MSGPDKVPQRHFMTKSLPNFRLSFLVRFASKPLFHWVIPSDCSENSLVPFVRFFGFVSRSWPLIVLCDGVVTITCRRHGVPMAWWDI